MDIFSEKLTGLDPTPLFDLFRGNYGTELLVSAIHPFKIFEHLNYCPMTFSQLCAKTDLAERPMNVLLTALLAMKTIQYDSQNRYELTPLAKQYLVTENPLQVTNYFGLAAKSPGVLGMIERLKTNRPWNSAPVDTPKQVSSEGVELKSTGSRGAAFIFREGIDSAMETSDSARELTLALAGRAKNVAPVLAQKIDLSQAKVLVDVGGGTGIYSIAMLKINPHLKAIIWDRPEVLKLAKEFASEYDVTSRLELIAGDMFVDPVPEGDHFLLSNILHDWDVPECKTLLRRIAEKILGAGRLLIHDVFLNDRLDGPLPMAFYSASLFTLTEGRLYSAREYKTWLEELGLVCPENPVPTHIHCGVLVASRRGNP